MASARRLEAEAAQALRQEQMEEAASRLKSNGRHEKRALGAAAADVSHARDK